MKKLMVNTKTIQQFNPCKQGIDNWIAHYQQQTYDFLTFLNLPNVPAWDKVWLAVRLLPRELVEVFAIDCAFEALKYRKYDDAADAADAAIADAADAAAAAHAHAYAADAADAAAAAYAAADAAHAYAAADAAYTYAADADAYTAYATDVAYAAAAERERQLDCLAYLYKERYK